MPLGLAYLAAVLKKPITGSRSLIVQAVTRTISPSTPNGRFKVQGLDEQRSLELIDRDTDIIGVSMMFSQDWPQVREYINHIRRAFPHAKIIIGGEHPTAMSEYTLRDCPAIDYVVRGEGELKLLEVVYSLRSGKPVQGVSGVAYLSTATSSRLPVSPPSGHQTDAMARLAPHRRRALFSTQLYHGNQPWPQYRRAGHKRLSLPVYFLLNPSMWTTRYVMRSVSEVVNEIVDRITKYQVNSIDFSDLTAIVKRDWILEFTAELEQRDIHITWQLPSGTRSEGLDEEVIKGLGRTGCEFLAYAPESGSQHTLDMSKKRVNLQNLQKSIAIAVMNGITTKVNFIIGFPFESRVDIFRTLRFVWKLALMNVNDRNISIMHPKTWTGDYDTCGVLM